MSKVPPIPPDQLGFTPYIIVRGAAEALAFYAKAFGAEETMRLDDPKGRVSHAEMRLGKVTFMLAEEHPEHGIVGPATLGNTSVTLHLYVEDVDAVAARAMAAGAELTRPIADQFFGDRVARLRDPFGHHWAFASRIEEVSPEEMKRRAQALFGGG